MITEARVDMRGGQIHFGTVSKFGGGVINKSGQIVNNKIFFGMYARSQIQLREIVNMNLFSHSLRDTGSIPSGCYF